MEKTASKVPEEQKEINKPKTAGGSDTGNVPVTNISSRAGIGGRKTVMIPAVLGKLEHVFALDGTVEEACFYADINPDTYYTYVKTHPEFSERVEALKMKPVLAARETVIKDLNTPSGAQWYLSRKRKIEFGTGEEQAQKIAGVNVYNFFMNDEAQAEVKLMEDRIKEALTKPKHVESI